MSDNTASTRGSRDGLVILLDSEEDVAVGKDEQTNNTNESNPNQSKQQHGSVAIAAAPSEECKSAGLSRKRPMAKNVEMPNIKKVTVDTDETNGTESLAGCMYHPKNPIKIFATHQDEELRKTLQPQEIESHWSFQHCWTLREMMGLDRFVSVCQESRPCSSKGVVEKILNDNWDIGIDFILITTYLLDIDFLISELPELLHVPTVIVIYEYKDPSQEGEQLWKDNAQCRNHKLLFLQRSPKAEPRNNKFNKHENRELSANPLYHRMEYGCHHTKLFLVKYRSNRLRLNVTTANLRPPDVHLKCQGAFLQDFKPKTQDQLDRFVTSEFEQTLITYVESYHIMTPLLWDSTADARTLVQHLQSYDFSTAVGVLIPSIPGYHSIQSIRKRGEHYGYLKVQQCIQKHCTAKSISTSNSGHIVCQFSSIGSLSIPYLDKVTYAWNVQTAANDAVLSKPPRDVSSSMLKIVWPTYQEVVESVEGFDGGGSVPGRTKNLIKPFIKHLLHKWKSVKDGSNPLMNKGKNVPHIKTYYQMSSRQQRSPNNNNNTGGDDDDDESMEWFVLSSHNLSKAAWGEIQNRRLEGEVLTIQHWELGVFFSPSTLRVNSMGPLLNDIIQEMKDTEVASSSREAANPPIETPTRRAIIALPFKFRPDKYGPEDKFWATDLV